MKYTGHEIVGVIMNHHEIDDETGAVTEKFGWINNGIDNLREALFEGIHTIQKKIEQKSEAAKVEIHKAQGAWFKTKKNIQRQEDADADFLRIYKKLVDVVVLVDRIKNATDIAEDERSRFPRLSKVSPDLIEECRDWIIVELLELDEKYEVNIPLFQWTNDPKNAFYQVEDDFTISKWRMGTSGYTNNPDGSVRISYVAYMVDPHKGVISDRGIHVTYHRGHFRYDNGDILPSGERGTSTFFKSKQKALDLLKIKATAAIVDIQKKVKAA